ncbi:MAG: PilN domain-containing protein [Myxococcota bacterium]|jgi:type IV pilus assembly protein PilN
MMMKINLLPHREARRAADLRETVAVLLLGLIVICGGVFFVDKGVKSDLAMAEANVTQLQADIDRYKPQQKLVESFKKQKKQLQNKLDIIGSLEAARNGPVRVLDELTAQVPDRLWLTAIMTKGKGIKLEGQSLDTGVVADFLRGLNSSPYFTNVDLDKTAGGKIVDGIRLVSFEIRADMQTPVAKADDAKS